MSTPLPEDRPVKIAIHEIGISAASPIAARRLADALPAALERAFAVIRGSPAPAPRIPKRDAHRAAADVVRAVMEHLEAKR